MFTFMIWEGDESRAAIHRVATYEQAKVIAAHLATEYERVDIIYKGSVVYRLPTGVSL